MIEAAPSFGYRVQGSDAPEIRTVRIGYMPLTDCASVIVAAQLGFDRKYGIRLAPSREMSWAGLRDKLLGGALHAAHMLYGLVYGIQLGIAGPARDMAVLLTLNQNGQGITLGNHLRQAGVSDGETLRRYLDTTGAVPLLAHTFPTGTHAMYLYLLARRARHRSGTAHPFAHRATPLDGTWARRRGDRWLLRR